MGLTDEQAEQLYHEMEDYFNGYLPNPDTEPRRAASYIKIFKHVRNINNNDQKSNQ
jgi:hypothetical protein